MTEEGSDVGRKRECTKDGFPPTSGAAPRKVGDAELAYSDEVKTTFRKAAGVERHTTADIHWKGTADIAHVKWDVTVTDNGANGTIDYFVLEKPAGKREASPAEYYHDNARTSCWKLRHQTTYSWDTPPSRRETEVCTAGVYEAVDEAYQAALVRLGLKKLPPPAPEKSPKVRTK